MSSSVDNNPKRDEESIRADERIRMIGLLLIGNENDPSRYEGIPNAAVALLADSETKRWGDANDEWFAAYLDCAKPFERKVAFLVNNTNDGAPAQANVDGVTVFAFNMAIPATPLDVFAHIAVKLILNNISTATMGKYGRLNGNWMAHVDATNKIGAVDYKTACVTLFEALEEMESWPLDRKKTISPAAYAVELLKKKSNA